MNNSNQDQPGLPNFRTQKNPGIENFKPKKSFDHPRHLKSRLPPWAFKRAVSSERVTKPFERLTQTACKRNCRLKTESY